VGGGGPVRVVSRGGRGVLAQRTRGSRRSEALASPGSGRRHRPGRVGVGDAGLLRAIMSSAEEERGKEMRLTCGP
jgi:hypothetical protein